MPEFTWCPKLPDFTLIADLESKWPRCRRCVSNISSSMPNRPCFYPSMSGNFNLINTKMINLNDKCISNADSSIRSSNNRCTACQNTNIKSLNVRMFSVRYETNVGVQTNTFSSILIIEKLRFHAWTSSEWLVHFISVPLDCILIKENSVYSNCLFSWVFEWFAWFDSLRPINNLSVIKDRIFLGWTSTQLHVGLMCVAQGHSAVTPVRLEPMVLRSRIKHSTTEPLRSLVFVWYLINVFNLQY